MTALIEQIAREVHGALSHIDVMHYLDMPSDTADRVAQAILPIITRAVAAERERFNSVIEWADDTLLASDPDNPDSYFNDNKREFAESIAFNTNRDAIPKAIIAYRETPHAQ